MRRSLKAHGRALEIREKVLGPEHPPSPKRSTI
jgi:hypothetical protein